MHEKLSKKLIPLPVEIQKEFRKKYNFPNGFFYSNEVGDFFCAITRAFNKERSSFRTEVVQFKKDHWVPAYSGTILVVGKPSSKRFHVTFEIAGSTKQLRPPSLKERGRQAFRIIIEEALRLGAKKIELYPLNEKLAGYYRKKFGFRKKPKSSFFEIPTRERKIPRLRV